MESGGDVGGDVEGGGVESMLGGSRNVELQGRGDATVLGGGS